MNESTRNPHPVRVWDLPTRVFHWTLALSFGGAYLLAESERLRQVHVMFGYTVLALIAFRFLWGFIGTRYARFSSFLFGPRAVLGYAKSIARGAPEHHLGHNPIGSYAIYAILVLGVLTGISGYCTLNEIGGDAAEELHEVIANIWLAVVIVHIGGVIVSSVLHRENLVRAMITGYKRASEQSVGSTQGSSARTGVGILAALAVLTFWVGSLLTGGPSAAGNRVESTVAETHEGDED
jgi:cytochrome b